jgi:hypothetical protein
LIIYIFIYLFIFLKTYCFRQGEDALDPKLQQLLMDLEKSLHRAVITGASEKGKNVVHLQ